MIEQIDLIIRCMTIGAAIVLAAMVAIGEIRTHLKVPLVCLVVGAMGYLLNGAPQFHFSPIPKALIDYVSLATTFFIWLFARRLFEREPAWTLMAGIAVIFTVAWAFGHFLAPNNSVSFYVIHAISLLLVGDIIYSGWSGRSDDLVERRRLIRLWLPLLVGLQAGTILLYETIIGGPIDSAPLQIASVTLILTLIIFSALTLMRPDAELLVATEMPATSDEDASALSPAELVLQEKLDAAMKEGFYRTPGLTIAALAEHLSVPEHRLRALINGRLGHRNFSAFLNGYRITEACEILADKARVDLPVLTIAMDLGYNSLPTFNRAFRAQTSQTPTDFRRAAIGQN